MAHRSGFWGSWGFDIFSWRHRDPRIQGNGLWPIFSQPLSGVPRRRGKEGGGGAKSLTKGSRRPRSRADAPPYQWLRETQELGQHTPRRAGLEETRGRLRHSPVRKGRRPRPNQATQRGFTRSSVKLICETKPTLASDRRQIASYINNLDPNRSKITERVSRRSLTQLSAIRHPSESARGRNPDTQAAEETRVPRVKIMCETKPTLASDRRQIASDINNLDPNRSKITERVSWRSLTARSTARGPSEDVSGRRLIGPRFLSSGQAQGQAG